jgi:glycosidase
MAAVCCLILACNSNNKITMNQPELLNDSNTTSETIANNKLIIYQMMTRLFGNKTSQLTPYGTIEQNGVGKFNDVTDTALLSLKGMGFTHIWYTGIIEHATLTNYAAFGILPDDPDVVKGRAGSSYSIKDYYDVNPDLAVDVKNRMKEFEALLTRTHNQDLKVLIDFIPNHVARGYKSDMLPAGINDIGSADDVTKAFDAQNNFYYLPGKSFVVPKDYKPIGNHTLPGLDGKFIETPAKVTGNDVFNEAPSANDWFEAAKLNYGVDYQNNRQNHFEPIPDTWIKMKDILLFWASKKVDGFRCDMAEMVPVAFWNYAISEVKQKYPQVIFIAEIYGPAAYNDYVKQGKFDYLYDKVGVYDAIRRLTTNSGNTKDITHCWKNESRNISNNMLRFMENHDEQRIASKYFAGNAMKGIPGMVISASMGSGPLLIYFGQELGEPAMAAEGFSGDDGRTSIFDYCHVPAIQAWMNGGTFDGGGLNADQALIRTFYTALIHTCNTNEAIQQGRFYELQEAQIGNAAYNDTLMYAFARFTTNEKVIVVSNFQNKVFEGTLRIPDVMKKALHISEKSKAIDLLSGAKFKCNADGVELKLPEMSAVIIRLF